MAAIAPYSPVADWRAVLQGDHFGNYFDPLSGGYATVTRATPKTVYDSITGRIHDVPAGYLAVRPWACDQAGATGYAAIIEEARTNYLLNSYGAAATNSLWDSWTVARTTVNAPTYSLVPGVYGQTALRIRYTSPAGESNKAITLRSPSSAAGTFAPNDSLSGSAYFINNSSGVTVDMNVVSSTSADALVGYAWQNVGAQASFARVSKVYVSAGATTDHGRIDIYCSGISEGDTLDITIDAAQLEKGAFATSYIPTTTAAATRNADVVTVPTTGWSAAAGTMVAVRSTVVMASTYAISLTGTAGNANRVLLGTASNGHQPAMLFYGADAAGATAVAGSGTIGTPAVHAGTWSTTKLYAYLNGAPGAGVDTDAADAVADAAYIGLTSTGANYTNAPIARLTVYASALTDAQIASSGLTSEMLAGPKSSMAAKLLAIGVL
ncbi:MAG: LamG domain-containing protein [Bacteroidales bacterium]|nr:LamG domain-containing protein [Bacteroidales bacterium]